MLLFTWFKGQNLGQKSVLHCWILVTYLKKSDSRILRASWWSQYRLRDKIIYMVWPEHSEFLCTLSLVTESRNVLSQEHPRPRPWLPLSAHTAITPLLCSSQSELTWPTFCQQNPLLSWRYLWPCQHGIYIWILIMGDFSQLSALDLWTDIFSCTKCTFC